MSGSPDTDKCSVLYSKKSREKNSVLKFVKMFPKRLRPLLTMGCILFVQEPSKIFGLNLGFLVAYLGNRNPGHSTVRSLILSIPPFL